MPLSDLKDLFLQKEKEIYKAVTDNPYIKQLGVDATYEIQTGKVALLIKQTAKDAVRIAKWWPTWAGISFTLNQQGLRMMNPKVETISAGSIPDTRIFNPIKFTAEYLGSPWGLHIPVHGLINEYSYENVIKLKTDNDKLVTVDTYSNRLVRLGVELGIFSNRPPNSIFTVLTGAGGPNSLMGLGITSFTLQTSGNHVGLRTNYAPINNVLHLWSDMNTYSAAVMMGTNYSFNSNRLNSTTNTIFATNFYITKSKTLIYT